MVDITYHEEGDISGSYIMNPTISIGISVFSTGLQIVEIKLKGSYDLANIQQCQTLRRER